MVVAAIAVASLPRARAFVDREALASAIERASQSPGVLPVRLAGNRPVARAGLVAGSSALQRRAVVAAIDRAATDPSPAVLHDAGVASLLAGAASDATQFLKQSVRAASDAASWADLGAAEYVRAMQSGREDEMLASLAASSRALSISPRLDAAQFNFAIAAERLGFAPAAMTLWRDYVVGRADDEWRRSAQERLRELGTPQTDNAAWVALTRGGLSGTVAIERAVTRYPQQARLWTESETLADWSEAAQKGDAAAASAHLDAARAVGVILRRTTGESLLADGVTSIDRATTSRDGRALEALMRGHAAYRAGKRLYRENNLQGALGAFRRSSRSLAAAGSPMAALPAAFVASVLHDLDRFADARKELAPLLSEVPHQYAAIRAQLLYQRARLNSIEGRWSDSLDDASSAVELFHGIRESGSEGMAALLMAEAHDFIGRPQEAIRYAFSAVRLLSTVGDSYRMRVATAILCRSAMRRQDWGAAQALIRIEHALDAHATDPVQTTDLALREAVVQNSLGDVGAVQQALQSARDAIGHIPDATLHESLLADLDAASGALLRRRRPADGIELLTRAIGYCEKTDRVIQLPQFYLERGRAFRDARQPIEAIADFERGIRHLEQQRSSISDTASRYGLFDDAHDLFAEEAASHLARHDVASAFLVVERGRARTLLEQLAGDVTRPISAPPLASLREALPAHTLLIEYSVIGGRLVAFLAAREFVDVRTGPDAHVVAAAVLALTTALSQRYPLADVLHLSARLRDMLLGKIPERGRYTQLIFVPDATLQQVPFSALYDEGAKKYLIEQHIVATAPSGAVFLESIRRTATRQQRPASIAIISGARATKLSLRALPEVGREVDAIAPLYPAARMVRGGEVTVDQVIREIDRAPVVHFGGHALVDPTDPSRSALVIGVSHAGGEELLDCRTIGSHHFGRTQIVVLASCSTLRSGTDRGEGVPTIARSFLAAGVPSVVGTLWDIDDAETADLVADLHRGLSANVAPAAALRAAQLNALRNPYAGVRHPGSWAAFTVVGGSAF